MKKPTKLIVTLFVILITLFGIIYLRYHGFWADLRNFGVKNSLVIFSESLECAAEGEILSSTVYDSRKSCCQGLTIISLDRPNEDKYSKNECTQHTLGGGYCTNCGDSICGLGENICNCSKDCNN